MSCNADIYGPYSQTLFCGATISSFSHRLGWNSDESSLDVTVVEDPCSSDKVYYACDTSAQLANTVDSFNPPELGSPVYFKIGSLEYTGILRNWKEDRSDTKTYAIQASGPNVILEAVKVIIGGYNGDVLGVPNVLNAYGFLEEYYGGLCQTDPSLYALLGYYPALGFGGASKTQAGIAWNQLRTALIALINSSPVLSGKFGVAPVFCGNTYYIDLSNLPATADDFRITGDVVSLFDLINQICDYAGMDWYAKIELSGGSCDTSNISGHIDSSVTKTITIYTSVRSTQSSSAQNVDDGIGLDASTRLALGTITSFITENPGSNYTRGIELRPETTNSMVIGDLRQDLWQIQSAATGVGTQNTYTGNIWPYWGKNSSGYPIISQGVYDNHNFNIDITDIWDGVLDTVVSGTIGTVYNVTLGELCAAVDEGGESSWYNYVEATKPAIASGLNLAPDGAIYPLITAKGAVGAVKTDNIKSTSRFSASRGLTQALDPDADFATRLYNKIVGYAQEYLGKKFLVTTPIICSATNSDTPFSVDRNWDVSDGAWTEGDVLDLNTGTNLATDALELFRLPDGRLQCLLKFDNSGYRIDMSNWDSSDYFQPFSGIVYTRATVEEIVYLDPVNALYPRAVVSVQQPVRANQVRIDEDAYSVPPVISSVTAMAHSSLNLGGGLLTNLSKHFNALPGADTIRWGMLPVPLWPVKAAVPFKSTTLRYGPWKASSFSGDTLSTEAVIEPDLNPWNYGNIATMNTIGTAIATNKTLDQKVVELGSITLAGIPQYSLGDSIYTGTPELTNIDVSVSKNEVTTSYQLRTFTPDYNTFSKTKIDQIRKRSQDIRYIQRLDRLARLNQIRTPETKNALGTVLNRTDRYTRASSHSFILANAFNDYEMVSGVTNATISSTSELSLTSRVCNFVTDTDLRKCIPEFGSGNAWLTRAGMEQQGLFRPFTTKSGEMCLMPSFHTDKTFVSRAPAPINQGAISGAIENDYDVVKNDQYSFRGQVLNEAIPPIVWSSINPFLQPETAVNSSTNIGLTDDTYGIEITLGSGYGHDIEYIIRDGIYPLDLSIKAPEYNYSNDGWYRGIGIKGPPIIVGWGLDIYGKPVPNLDEIAGSGGKSCKFANDWLNRSDLYKAGPLDIRWDERRGVWTSPPDNRLVRIKFMGEPSGAPMISPYYSYTGPESSVSMKYAEIFDDNLHAYDGSGNLLTNKQIVVHVDSTTSSSSGTLAWAFYNPDKTHPSGYQLANYEKYDLVTSPGSAVGATMRFQVLSAGPFYGSGDVASAAECITVQAEVLNLSCSYTGASIGDEVTVWDPNGCWFNIPIENIEGAYGTATLLARGGSFEQGGCIDALGGQPNDCFWMVVQLCCLEQVGV